MRLRVLCISFCLSATTIALVAKPLIASPVAVARSLQAWINDRERLVALLVGDDLPLSFQKRIAPRSVASSAALALIAGRDASLPALAAGMESSRDPLQRLNIVYVLASMRTPGATPLLIKATNDEAIAARCYALRSLPVFQDREAYQTAIAALSQPPVEAQIAAIDAFAQTRRIPTVTTRPANDVRFAAATEISKLLDIPEARYAAAYTLGALDSNVAVRPLIAVLNDDRREVRSQIVQSLGQLKDPEATVALGRMLKDPDQFVRMFAASALGKIADLRAVNPLLEALQDSAPAVRRDSALALAKVGDRRATLPIVALLDDPEIAMWIAEALGQLGDPRAVDGLIKALHGDKRTAGAAAASLGKIGDPRAIGALGDYLETHLDSRDAADALAKIRHPSAVAALAKVATTKNSMAARNALGNAVGRSFSSDPPEKVAEWWAANRAFYLDTHGAAEQEKK